MRMEIEAEVRVPIATAQIVRFEVPEILNMTVTNPGRYVLDMSLTPRPEQARGCYRDHWDAARFERAGAIFLLPPNETVTWRAKPGCSTSVMCYLRPDAVTTWLDADLAWPERGLAASLDVRSPGIRLLLNRLGGELRNPGIGAETMVELLAREIALELARLHGYVEKGMATGALAPWRLRLIDKRLEESGAAPRLSELAALCGISVRQLTRGFRASRGFTIGAHITQKRTDAAKQALRGEVSISEIAQNLGFASVASFTYAFRQATGITPSQFRMQMIREIRRGPAAA